MLFLFPGSVLICNLTFNEYSLDIVKDKTQHETLHNLYR